MRISAGGAVYYYHRRTGHRLIPLSTGVDPDDQVAVDQDFADQAPRFAKALPSSREPSQTDLLRRTVRKAVWRARERAKVIGKPFDLTPAYVTELLKAQGECCAITGIRFRIDDREGQRTTPYRPSIDRIDNASGYVAGNVQLVLLAVNLGKADFDLDTYLQVCQAVARAAGANRTRPSGANSF